MDSITITQADIDILRTLPPRKSILNFTEEEKNATLNWSKRYYNDIRRKSPYFRADFGDWRAKEEGTVPIIEISDNNTTYPQIKADVKNSVIERGVFINSDTNWQIQVSRKGIEDTIRYAFKHNDSISYNMLYSVKSLVENGTLLDSVLSEHNKNNKAQNTSFMHNLYAVCNVRNDACLAKIIVEEFPDMKGDTLKRLYNLQDIKIEPIRVIGLADNQLRPAALNGSKISISDLFQIVKTFDKKFYTNSPDFKEYEYSEDKNIAAVEHADKWADKVHDDIAAERSERNRQKNDYSR